MQLAVSFSPEMQRLREGEREFERGNYPAAETIFQEISTGTGNTQTRNTALYDLACARIMTAADSEELLSAIHLLDGWQPTPPGFLYIENPNMVVTALKVRTGAILEDKMAIEEERDKARSRMRKNKKTIAGHQRKIAELNSRLQKLQHQIDELEAIDSQLQEKKNPL
jgi:TolA-binding protein